MQIKQITSDAGIEEYEQWLTRQPQASLWQSLAWKRYQEALGRETRIYVADDDKQIVSGALISVDRTRGGLTTWEIIHGPIGEDAAAQELMHHIIREARNERCMAVYVSPLHADLKIGDPSARTIVPEATRIIDLSPPTEEILRQMKEKGRYNIRLAEKHGVIIEESKDVDVFYKLMHRTADRDGFTIKPKGHYQAFLNSQENAFLLLAYAPSTSPDIPIFIPIAALIGTIHNETGIYYYGASDHEHRALMAPFLLQWKAMQYCKGRGCRSYDLFGIAPPNVTHHSWSGISNFKEKFGGTIILYPPERQIILRPMMHRMLQWKRRII